MSDPAPRLGAPGARARRVVPGAVLAVVLGAAAALAQAQTLAQAQATPVGLWKTIDDETGRAKSLVRITLSASSLRGTVEKLLDPSAPPDAVCSKCTDARRDQPILGMQIIRGVHASDSDPLRWEGGEILDPNNGKVYQVRLTLSDGGKTLSVRGYIGTPLLGRTQVWMRVEPDAPN